MNVLTLHVLCYFLTISRYISSQIHPQARFLNELTCYVKLVDTKQLNFANCKCKTAALFSMNCWSLVPLLFGEAEDTPLLLFFEIFISLGCFPSFLVILDQIPSLNIPFFLVVGRRGSFVCWYHLGSLSSFFSLSKQNICWEILSYHTHNLLNITYSSFLARFLFRFCFSLMVCFHTCCSLCLEQTPS